MTGTQPSATTRRPDPGRVLVLLVLLLLVLLVLSWRWRNSVYVHRVLANCALPLKAVAQHLG